MIPRLSSHLSRAVVILAAALAPALARAQSAPPGAEAPPPSRAPSLIVSMAASPLGLDDWRRSDGPALVGSVQGRLNRFLVLEGEVTRWAAVDDFGTSHRDREVWTVGTNLLLRGGRSRVTGFAGGGLGVRFVREDSSASFSCPPGPGRPSICTGDVISQSSHQTDTSLTPQFLVGGEFWITQRLAAYGGARFAFSSDQARSTAGFTPLAGIRMALRTTAVVPTTPRLSDPTRAIGKDVRVTLHDGTKHEGKLETLSATDVSLEGKAMPLADVRTIEKVGKATRKAVAIGILAGLPTLVALGSVDIGSDMSLAIVGAGVGAGIAVGAVIDAVRRPGNLIYRAPGTSASFAVRPILTPDRQGVALATRW